MKIDTLMMPWIPMSKGVRQGSPLSPLLFNVFLTLLDTDSIKASDFPKIKLYADDIVVICKTKSEAERIDAHLNRKCAELGLSLNYAPDKSCYMQTSPPDRKQTGKIGKLQRVEKYQYLGTNLSTTKQNYLNYRGLTKNQSLHRSTKFKLISNKFSWMLKNKSATVSDINNLILAITRGNLYGVITPFTNLTIDYRTKGSTHIQKWESQLRKIIKETYDLPRWTKNDVLHTITGIPHFRIILLNEIIAKIKRWRYLIGAKSPLVKEEKTLLTNRLKQSTLIRSISSLLKVENPTLQTTDWNSVQSAHKKFLIEYWRNLKDRTKLVRSHERAERFTNGIEFNGWKLLCQMTVSRVCTRPTKVPPSKREQCPGCHQDHKDFEACLIRKGYHRPKMVNGRLARILIALKRWGKTDRLDCWDSSVTQDYEWLDLGELIVRYRAKVRESRTKIKAQT